jgi:fucose 4-O-acetylase-like acetyltransferase
LLDINGNYFFFPRQNSTHAGNDFFPLLFVAALYFVAVAAIAALVGQHLVRKVIAILGRASLIIFILASTIFISAISLGMCHYVFLND